MIDYWLWVGLLAAALTAAYTILTAGLYLVYLATPGL
jgi:hypothetical protein